MDEGMGMVVKTVRAVHVDDADNCVTLTTPAGEGDLVVFSSGGSERSAAALGAIPKWHKMAVAAIEKGGSVYKYGAVIGIASEDIKAGDCVHIHNMRSPGG